MKVPKAVQTTEVENEIKLEQKLTSFHPTVNDIVLSQFCFSTSHVWNKTLKQLNVDVAYWQDSSVNLNS